MEVIVTVKDVESLTDLRDDSARFLQVNEHRIVRAGREGAYREIVEAYTDWLEDEPEKPAVGWAMSFVSGAIWLGAGIAAWMIVAAVLWRIL